jgi:hypothetical protein
MRESPKVSTTTLLWKRNKGTRLIAEPNGKNVENKWTIRREVPKFFLEYGKPSTTRWRWADTLVSA